MFLGLVFIHVIGDLLELGVFLFAWVLAVRVYRYNQVLVKYNTNMWPAERQLLIGISCTYLPYRLTAWFYTLFISDDIRWFFVEDGQSCRGTVTMGDAVGAWGPIIDNLQTVTQAIGVLAFAWNGFALRKVRAQFNESNAVFIAVGLGVVSIARSALGFLPWIQLPWDTFVSQTAFWVFMWSPFVNVVRKDPQYLYKYTYGLNSLPTPELLKAKLEGQLENSNFRERFRAFAGKRFAVENLDFYDAVQAWELELGWFSRQAMALQIIDTYIRQGSPSEINIPGTVRDAILSSPVTNLDLFKAAKNIVIRLMENDLAPQFQETEEMQALAKDVDNQASELAAAAAAGLIKAPAAPAPPANPEI